MGHCCVSEALVLPIVLVMSSIRSVCNTAMLWRRWSWPTGSVKDKTNEEKFSLTSKMTGLEASGKKWTPCRVECECVVLLVFQGGATICGWHGGWARS